MPLPPTSKGRQHGEEACPPPCHQKGGHSGIAPTPSFSVLWEISRPDCDSSGRMTTGILAWLSAEHHPRLQGLGKPFQEALGNAALVLGKGFWLQPLLWLLVLWRMRDSAGGQCVFNTHPSGTCRPCSLLTKTDREGGREGGRRSERRGERTYADLRPQQLSRI